MTNNFNSPQPSTRYRNVYVVESRAWWNCVSGGFDAERDLVLTYDFALRQEICSAGGRAYYFDYLVDPEVMEANNHLTYEFFRRWFLDQQGRDIFVSRGVSFGFSFRIDIWNDLIFSTRTRLCLDVVAGLQYETLQIGTRLRLVEKLATSMGLKFTSIAAPATVDKPEYLFPIHRWMDEKVRSKKFRHRIKPAIAVLAGRFWNLFDHFIGSKRLAVFVQEYYPTRAILERLQRDPRLRVQLAQYSWAKSPLKFLVERPIPLTGSPEEFAREAATLLAEFHARRATRFTLANGSDFTADVFALIEERLVEQLPAALCTLASVLRALERKLPRLQVMISNLGRMHAMVDAVCRQHGVPSYLLINGMLGHAYLDEGKYADLINSYATNIRNTYFRGMSNIVCLGDPRMDSYAVAPARRVEREAPTIVVGASGHNVTNLGSYVAVEFEFLYDVLTAMEVLRQRGVRLRVILKLRDNGYREHYEGFVREYFGDLAPEIITGAPMRSVLDRADFYISIYSQTLFEASCLGIPALYYKKDTETIFAPFDGHSELVTVDNVADLVQAIEDFRACSDRFDAFLRRDVMEKYIGPLDGRNLERNMEQIEQLLFASREPLAT